MQIDLTPLMSGAITVLAAACTAFVGVKLVPEIKKLWRPVVEKWPTEATFLEHQAELAVSAAEQSLGPSVGGTKLLYALEYVQRQAEKYGFTYNRLDVQTLVEAKVREMKERASAAVLVEKP